MRSLSIQPGRDHRRVEQSKNQIYFWADKSETQISCSRVVKSVIRIVSVLHNSWSLTSFRSQISRSAPRFQASQGQTPNTTTSWTCLNDVTTTRLQPRATSDSLDRPRLSTPCAHNPELQLSPGAATSHQLLSCPMMRTNRIARGPHRQPVDEPRLSSLDPHLEYL